MKTFFIIIISFLAFSCKTEKVLTDAEIAKNEESASSNTKILALLGEKSAINDAYTITSVELKGNNLIVVVTFSGECMDHEFKATGLTINQQSTQPIRQIQLVHLSNNDKCKKLITKTLEIDVKQIAVNKTVGSKTIFKIDGWNNEFEYTVH